MKRRLLYMLGGVPIEDYIELCTEYDELVNDSVKLLAEHAQSRPQTSSPQLLPSTDWSFIARA